MPDVTNTEWRNENQLRRYPFADGASVTSAAAMATNHVLANEAGEPDLRPLRSVSSLSDHLPAAIGANAFIPPHSLQ